MKKKKKDVYFSTRLLKRSLAMCTYGRKCHVTPDTQHPLLSLPGIQPGVESWFEILFENTQISALLKVEMKRILHFWKV